VGRPKQHLKPVWLTFYDKENSRREFYALDKISKLVNKTVTPDHIRQETREAAVLNAVIPEITTVHKNIDPMPMPMLKPESKSEFNSFFESGNYPEFPGFGEASTDFGWDGSFGDFSLFE
jgi:hypothetical protein